MKGPASTQECTLNIGTERKMAAHYDACYSVDVTIFFRDLLALGELFGQISHDFEDIESVVCSFNLDNAEPVKYMYSNNY